MNELSKKGTSADGVIFREFPLDDAALKFETGNTRDGMTSALAQLSDCPTTLLR